MAKRRRSRPERAWRSNAELAYLLGMDALPPVESFAREAWAIERGHFERLTAMYNSLPIASADRDLAGLEGRESPQMAILNGTAILPLHGVLSPSLPWYRLGTSTEQFAMQFASAVDNPEITRIILRVNSPGGSAQGSAEVSDLIYAARGRKPVIAWAVNGLMASAAYFAASAADQVYATPSSLIGSIGVLLAHFDLSGAAAQMGVRVTVLAEPERKKLGTEHEPLTDEKQQAIRAELLLPYYGQFVRHVARNRGVSEDAVRSGFGRGGVLIAGDALQASMIDRVADWNTFLREVAGQEAPRTVFGVRSGLPTPPATDGTGGPQGPPLDTHAAAIAAIAATTDKPDGPGDSSHNPQGGTLVKYSPQTLALLFAVGIISAMDAATDSVTAAVQGFCAARGVQMPTEEAALCALVKASMATPAPAPAAAAPPATAIRDAIAAERQRVRDIEARGQLLGLAADSPQVRTAIDNGVQADAFVNSVVNEAVTANRPLQAVQGVGRLDAGPAALDTFATAAVDALLLRSQSGILAQARAANPANGAAAEQETREAIQSRTQQNQAVREIAGMAWPDIVRQAVQLAGVHVRERTPLGYAQAFLSLGGGGHRPFASGHARIAGSDLMAFGPALDGPGDYPSIMDGVANRVVMFATQMAPVSYMLWAGRISDLQNFQPREVVTFGQFGELPLHVDGRPYEQSQLPNEAAWLQGDEYGDEFVLTPRMVLSDPMDTLIRGLVSKQIAHERTLNRLCVNLLTGNVASPSTGNACYSHNNDVKDDGGPSIDSLSAMRRLINAQTRVGSTEEAGLDLAIVITGSHWLTQAQIVTWTVPGMNLYPNSLDNVNPFTYLRPVYDPMVSGASNDGLTWYGAADPALLPGVVYGFIAGYGPGGRRTTYFNPSTGAQHFKFQGAFGAALLHHESLVRADGQPVEEEST
jgi:signal peptide peptidase SppA